MPDVRPDIMEVYEMVTKDKPSDPGALDRQRTRQIRTMRNRKIGAIALTSVMAIAVILLIVRNGPGERGKGTANEPSPSGRAETAAEEVARDFFDAFETFDANAAMRYLADDADVAALVMSLGGEELEGTRDELPLFLSMLQAMRYEPSVGSSVCSQGSASATEARCSFSFYFLGSDDFGREAFRGSYLDISVRDRKIVRVSAHWDTEELSAEMWEPFAEWVSTNHPEDAAVMYEDTTYGAVHITERSIGLWGKRVREFVSEVGSIQPAPADGWLSRVVDRVSLSLRVPDAAWTLFGQTSINKSIMGPQGAEAMVFWSSFPAGEYATPCAPLSSQAPDTSAADLAYVVSIAPGTELVAGPSDVTVGGLPAQHVVLRVLEDVGCDPGYFYTWPDVRWGSVWPGTTVGDTIQLWIVDVEGTTLFIEAETTEQADVDLEREIKQIIGSIRFG